MRAPLSIKTGWVLAAAVVLPFACLTATAQTSGEHETAAQRQAPSERRWESGKELYEKVCAYCHDPAVGVGTVLAGRVLPEVYVRAILRSGLNAMPAFPASYIDDESIALVAEYLSSLPAPASQP